MQVSIYRRGQVWWARWTPRNREAADEVLLVWQSMLLAGAVSKSGELRERFVVAAADVATLRAELEGGGEPDPLLLSNVCRFMAGGSRAAMVPQEP